MHKKDFFKILSRDLPKDGYKARLLQELNDHWEDHGDHGTATIDRHMGDPHEFIHFYKITMQKKIALFLEALFLGVCAAPIAALPFVGNGFTETTEDILGKAVIWIATLLLSGLLYFLFYRWLWAHLKTSFPFEKKDIKAILPLLLLPGWYCAIALMLLLSFDDDTVQDHFFPLVISSYLLIQALAAWRASDKALSAKGEKRIRWIGLIGATSALMVGLVLSQTSGINILELPLFLLKIFVFLPFLNNLLLGHIIVGILAALFGLYILHGLFSALKNKKDFPLGKFFLALILVYGFSFHPKEDTSIAWQYPSVNVTKEWEKQELGPLYPWYRFLTQDGERAFSYAPLWIETGLRIARQDDASILLTELSEDPKELEWNELQRREGLFMVQVKSGEVYLPETFNCIDPFALEFMEPGTVKVLGGETYCQELFYKEQLIYSTTERFLIEDLVLSPDGEWLTIHFAGQGQMDTSWQADSIFLVHLKP
jgi:hypothetical protein